MSIRVAIAGVGNCASSLVQGVEYYKDTKDEDKIPGLMHNNFGGYRVRDIEFVTAFDVDALKVGKDLSEAIGASQNNTIKFADVPNLGVEVLRGPTNDGLGEYYRQMIEAPDEVLDGVRQVLHWLQIPKAVIGIETNKPEAIRVLTEKTKSEPEIQIFSLPTTYPQGAEKVLIYHTLGRIVAEGELPADQGVIVMNVSSVAFVSRYLKTGMPMVQRMLTVDGDAVTAPCNVVVPVGTPVQDVLEFAGWKPENVKKLLYGGPMMGISIPNPADPVLKSNNAILAFQKADLPEPSACIRCGSCIRACPLNLMPTEIGKAYRQKDLDALRKLRVTLCMNCGCCTYACPAKRRVAETNQLAKAMLMAKK